MWGYTHDIRLGWRGFLTPAALVWAIAVPYAVGVRQLKGRWPEPGGAEHWLRWAALESAAVAAAMLAERPIALWVGDVWLGRRLRRVLKPLLKRRQERWAEAHRLAVEHESEPSGPGHAAERNRIALSIPQSPTWMGDRMAALETRLRGEYGLDLASCWPRMWLIMPEAAREDLRSATRAWWNATTWGAWALLYALLAVAWWPVAMLSVLSWIAGLSQARDAVLRSTDLVEAAVDLYAPELTRSLSIPMPDGPVAPHVGRLVNARLRKGS